MDKVLQRRPGGHECLEQCGGGTNFGGSHHVAADDGSTMVLGISPRHVERTTPHVELSQVARHRWGRSSGGCHGRLCCRRRASGRNALNQDGMRGGVTASADAHAHSAVVAAGTPSTHGLCCRLRCIDNNGLSRHPHRHLTGEHLHLVLGDGSTTVVDVGTPGHVERAAGDGGRWAGDVCRRQRSERVGGCDVDGLPL